MSAVVVVDSSAWIEFFRGREIPLLEEALAEGRVRVPPLVVAELVSGATTRGDTIRVEDLARTLDLVPTPREHWMRVGALRRGCVRPDSPSRHLMLTSHSARWIWMGFCSPRTQCSNGSRASLA